MLFSSSPLTESADHDPLENVTNHIDHHLRCHTVDIDLPISLSCPDEKQQAPGQAIIQAVDRVGQRTETGADAATAKYAALEIS